MPPDDENVFKRDEFLYGVRARGAAGYGLWFLTALAAQQPPSLGPETPDG
jgi:phage major head subunit gpT-like protein